MNSIDFGTCTQALLGDENECGDIPIIKLYDNKCFVALVDILGHGREAREVGIMAKEYLENNYEGDLPDLMMGLHNNLRGTRGGVAALCKLNIFTGEFSYVGIGNITVRIFGVNPIRFLSRNGIVGYRIARPEKIVTKLCNKDLVLMYSDGIKEHFESFECKGMLNSGADDIASGILKLFSKGNDDASCIAIKYLNCF